MDDAKIRLLSAWYEATAEVALCREIVATELELRREIVTTFFSEPEEGPNTLPLADGWVLKATYKLDRKIDAEALAGVAEALIAAGVDPEKLVDLKPHLNMKAYRSLRKNELEAALLFEQALIVKPGTPTLELIAPQSKV